ncbi:MAG: beta-ketoacyl-[acyl-carrier-protein] synthase family protein [Fuerstiella sp.]|nr:beta-ketoacyl-[acyl-carrier-protein] synthase family protein [Fuerstiella sp.]
MTHSGSDDVVITGVGIFSPIGVGAEGFKAGLAAGVPGFRRSERLSYISSPDCICGEVANFTDATARKEHLRPLRKSVKMMCRDIQLGVAAALQAMENAGLKKGSFAPERAGVSFGANLMSTPPEVLAGGVTKCLNESGDFDYDLWGTEGLRGMEPLWLLCYLPNMPGCHIGIALDARGPNNSITHDEASGGLAINEAAGVIRRGRADIMLAGVTGTRLHNVKTAQSHVWDVLADGPPESCCRPLDATRAGEVVAETSCTLVLESREHAEKRGATLLGTVLSCGMSCVHTVDGKPNEQRAVEQAAASALRMAGVTSDELGHVNLGASGHLKRDMFEAQAIRRILGDRADVTPVTAPKSYIGSAGSGSSLAELAASLLTLQDGEIIRTLNCRNPDPLSPQNVVSGENQPTSNRLFLKTSVTRMGQASAVLIRT